VQRIVGALGEPPVHRDEILHARDLADRMIRSCGNPLSSASSASALRSRPWHPWSRHAPSRGLVELGFASISSVSSC